MNSAIVKYLWDSCNIPSPKHSKSQKIHNIVSFQWQNCQFC